MLSPLPAVIRAYLEATNAQDTVAMAACFAEDAVVHDEGEELHGIAAITSWLRTTTEKYRSHVEVVNGRDENNEIVVTGEVSGNFPGSPIQLEYHFTLKADKIAVLTIQA